MLHLMLLFLMPFLCAIVVLLFPTVTGKTLKQLAVLLSLVPLATLVLGNVHWIGTQVQYPWLPPLSIEFYLKIDELSLLFLFLTAVIVPISILAVNSADLPYPNTFYALVFLLEGLLFGFFTAQDLALFTIFWEAMLLPLYFIINIWGGPQRQAASLKFLIYMIAGSALMVAAVLALYFTQGVATFNISRLAYVASTSPYAPWLFLIFMLAFAVKTPLFPFHGWLPDTYYEAPTAGTILLSALLSKAGIYGILRIGMPLFPYYIIEWSPILLGLAIAGVFYGGLAAWKQYDYKRLLAYSSFSHVNFVLIGLFVWNQTAHSGAIIQALNHGITIAALFLVAGWLEERLKSTTIGQVSGLAKFMPLLCWLTLFFVVSSVALPGTNNFIGEILILFGLFIDKPWAAAFLALSVVLSVMYMLRWMQKVYFEAPSYYRESWIDIGWKQLAVALPLVALIVWIGVYPEPILRLTEPAVVETLVKLEKP